MMTYKLNNLFRLLKTFIDKLIKVMEDFLKYK